MFGLALLCSFELLKRVRSRSFLSDFEFLLACLWLMEQLSLLMFKSLLQLEWLSKVISLCEPHLLQFLSSLSEYELHFPIPI